MEFVETSVFSRYVQRELEGDSYRELQSLLIANPECGQLIRGSGGARKIRWASKGSGKSGGHRLIYYYAPMEDRCYMLIAFKKSEETNLTAAQIKVLREHIKRHFK